MEPPIEVVEVEKRICLVASNTIVVETMITIKVNVKARILLFF
jgi:hypothetical protein